MTIKSPCGLSAWSLFYPLQPCGVADSYFFFSSFSSRSTSSLAALYMITARSRTVICYYYTTLNLYIQVAFHFLPHRKYQPLILQIFFQQAFCLV